MRGNARRRMRDTPGAVGKSLRSPPSNGRIGALSGSEGSRARRAVNRHSGLYGQFLRWGLVHGESHITQSSPWKYRIAPWSL